MREEEILLRKAASRLGVEIELVDSRETVFDLENPTAQFTFDALLERDIAHSRALEVLRLFENGPIPTFNRYDVALTCGDKLATSKALIEAEVSTPRTMIALTPDSALDAIEEMGYPVVLKPITGSWGKLLAKVNDRDAAEAITEHKGHLGSNYHRVFYIQEFLEKSGRDIRVFVLGDEVICAIYRKSDHWITNTARGAIASKCELDADIRSISLSAARAVGGGILAIDLMEAPDGYTVTEVNYTMEFRNSIETTGVNIPEKIIEYVVRQITN